MTATIKPSLNDVDIESVAGLANKIQEVPEVAASVWSATVSWDQGFRSSASIREFDPIGSDEPTALGGTDTAPNPVEQVLAALGNCLAVGYAANATAAGITISDLHIDLSGNIDLHTFLGLAPDGNAGYESIKVDVHLESDASDEAVAELHKKVVGTSPVGHTLTRAVPVDISLA